MMIFGDTTFIVIMFAERWNNGTLLILFRATIRLCVQVFSVFFFFKSFFNCYYDCY